MNIIKRIVSALALIGIFCLVFTIGAHGESEIPTVGVPNMDCRSAILMEANTGTVLYEKNADEALPPASVTKIMTLLLVMEAIEDGKLGYSDIVTASANACSMGGSQIFLKEGEQMTVEDMIKSVVIASANDAAVALAEHISGSEEAFVSLMNSRASELGMKNTNFENTNGLDDTVEAHLTSARDIAIMSRELIRHRKITEYSSIWMDTIRNGEFGLTNTNRLVRFYKGATGLKTGSTSKAGFCISATAERDGMSLICVIMNAPTRDVRNASATALLDWGFANYTVYRCPEIPLDKIKVLGGVQYDVSLEYERSNVVIEKSKDKVEYKLELPESISAPVQKGDKIGIIRFICGGKEILSLNIISSETVEKIDFFQTFFRILCAVSIY